MPSGNDSGTPADYRITNPPPSPAPALAQISSGAVACATGAALELVGCLFLHSRPLVMFGFLVSLAGVGLVWSGLRKLKPSRVIGAGNGNPHGGSRQIRQIARASGSPGALLAADACPEPLLDTLYHLEANEHHECPKAWPVPCEITFYSSVDGTPLVSAGILHEKCDVVLRETELKGPGIAPHSILMTPLT